MADRALPIIRKAAESLNAWRKQSRPILEQSILDPLTNMPIRIPRMPGADEPKAQMVATASRLPAEWFAKPRPAQPTARDGAATRQMFGIDFEDW